jgi:hypothetical protein
MKLYTLNAKARAIAELIIDGLTDDLGGDESKACKKIGKKDGAYMQLVVECINKHTQWGEQYSFCHYYEQNGDMMRDPEVVLCKLPSGNFAPIMYQQDNMGMYQDFVDEPNERAQKSCRDFCNDWMKNIREQQDEYFTLDVLNIPTI